MPTSSIKLVLGKRYQTDLFISRLEEKLLELPAMQKIELSIEPSTKANFSRDDISYYFNGDIFFTQGYSHLDTPIKVTQAVRKNIFESLRLRK